MSNSFIIFNKQTLEKIAEVRTNHSISLDEALDLIDVTRLEPVNVWDPDYLINGHEVWYDDLDMTLEEEYIKAKYDSLLDKCIVPNASGRKCFSLAMLEDEDIRWIAENCPADWLDVTDDGGNNLYEIAEKKGFIQE